MTTLLFCGFVALAAFNAGTMTTLQLQHYGIYSYVGREHFAQYMRANNRAALVPAILPALVRLAAAPAGRACRYRLRRGQG